MVKCITIDREGKILAHDLDFRKKSILSRKDLESEYNLEIVEQAQEQTQEQAPEQTAHNAHYEQMGVQPIEVIRNMLTYPEYIGFLKGNVIKYSVRQGKKAGESVDKEADKCRWYMQKLADELQLKDVPY